MRRMAARRAEENQKLVRARRAGTKTGKEPVRKCTEYSDFYRATPGPYARQKQDETCGDFKTYIESGIVRPTY